MHFAQFFRQPSQSHFHTNPTILNFQTVTQEHRIFVGDSKQTARTLIVRYREGISLRDVIDATHLKTNDVMVTVLRSKQKTKPVFDELVRTSSSPRFEVRAQDVI